METFILLNDIIDVTHIKNILFQLKNKHIICLINIIYITYNIIFNNIYQIKYYEEQNSH